jgi:hypothetical protein
MVSARLLPADAKPTELMGTANSLRIGDEEPNPPNVLTHVELTWDEGKIERWIRFGQPVDDKIIDRQRRVLSFAPGSIFAFVRWQSNDFGTVLSRIDILRALQPHETMTSIGFMRPGGEILLRMSSWPKVQLVLQHIDAIERAGFDPVDVCPDHWRHIHNRLSANQEPRDYIRERHAVWLARKALSP